MTGRRVVTLGVLAGLLLAACTSAPEEPQPAAEPRPTTTSVKQRTPTPPATTAPRHTQPLVIAVHRTRGDLDASLALARRVVRGDQVTWSSLGAGPGSIDVRRGSATVAAATRDADVMAVVPASAVTPLVRVVSVDGVDPLRRPRRYPLQTKASEPLPRVVEVTVVGDIMLGRRVASAPTSRQDPAAPLRPLQGRLAGADLTVGNLESTLSMAGAPRQGDDSFAADPAVLTGLHDAGFDVVSLANNHTGDFGEVAFRRTLQRFAAGPIEQVGAGLDRASAWRPTVVERRGVRFGFVAFNAIGETPAAQPRQPGVAQVRMQPRTGPLSAADLGRAERAIRGLEARVDVVIVIPHWGDQYTNVPVPGQRRVGRALLDAGADLVVGGHPHWVQGVQVHRGGLVVHSLGNFVFDMDSSTQTQEGVMLDAVFWGRELRAVDFVPYVIGPDFAPRLTDGERAVSILDQVAVASDAPFD